MSKKLFALALSAMLVLSLLAGCGGNNGGSSAPAPSEGSSTPAATPDPAPAATGGSVYYLNFKPEADAAWQALAKEYLELLNKAKSITSLSVERYQAFAEAEKFLLEHALVIPFTADSTGYVAAKVNPFEKMHNSDGGWKYARVLTEPMTIEQYNACYEDWLVAREESRK